mmetsp:Transcript_19044/g.46004  ORF Transcript_19044/g.46004 Transcript_19044/m.46004 type:complete len:265 (-) Transcript_19044:423-1217(-)|eukprot:CAMPEP_0113508850 /NCGR_PEP_ID=MMETSP0014_2-20120614/37244_1 /TAXON_ID=2857 /ORGANISM="Nitzschia sp." /LENGTH=264 /DNA_ID=CAMNT_0000404605 /DNA_START=116 /DNA_END=910 /DNA_ORIENTATION=+ /assembly_acc=CAM_ASM_000159
MATTLEELLSSTAGTDPADPATYMNAFRPEIAVTPADCVEMLVDAASPFVYLSCDAQGLPYLVTLPFRERLNPGAGVAPAKLATVGDITAGAIGSMILLENTMFHLVTNALVHPAAGMTAAFQALGPGQVHLEVPDPADQEVVSTRRSFPVPHAYAGQVLALSRQRQLSWSALWTNICDTIVGDATLAVRYQLFVNYVRVCACLRAGAAAADPARVHGLVAQPDYQAIYQHLAMGRINGLIDLPPDLERPLQDSVRRPQPSQVE